VISISHQKPYITSLGGSREKRTKKEERKKKRQVLSVGNSLPARLLDSPPFPTPHFGILSGLLDHTLVTTASVSAVDLGSYVIEKHFTLSCADKNPDSEFSLEPIDLECLCRDDRDAWLSLGKPGFDRQRAEEGSKIFRRSLYFVKDLPSGHVITSEDIRRIQPGMGLTPKYFDQVVGSRLTQSVRRGIPVNWDSMVSKGE